jgi:ABC-2 type transport system ATP-binding protein
MDISIPVVMKDVGFRFRRKIILKSINLVIKPKERILLLGRNGGGKSTLLKIMAGLTSPKGNVFVFGKDPFCFEVKKKRTFVPQQIDYPEKITVGEVIRFVKQHYQKTIMSGYDLLTLYELKEDEYASALSSGQKKRLALALALLARPKLLLLDEPESGLDVQFRESVLNKFILSSQQQEAAIVMASHFFESVIQYFDRVLVLKDGVLVSDCSADSFIKLQTGRK